MSKRKKSKINFTKYLAIFLSIVSLLALFLVYFIGILPIEYFLVLSVLVIIIDLINIKLLLVKSKIQNAIGIFFSLILIIFMIIGITYELNTIDFLKQFGFNSYNTENYNLVVLKENNLELNDLDNKLIGHLDTNEHEGLNEATKKLKNKINYESIKLDDITSLLDNLLNEEVQAIILEDAQISIIEEENIETYEKIEIIYNIEVEVEISKIGKSVDVTQDAFNILISGIDTYGSITKVSRSDVNILITVNPKDKTILLVTIPRDYYILLPEFNEYDKLTHAGIYGIETSVEAVEELLDTNINYYIKVNFTSLIDIVDAFDGIKVNSNYEFTSQDGYYFKKGENYLDGKMALSFARERKAFALGDRVRGENQEIILEALINKAMNPNIITKYTELLDALKDKFITNITDEEITKFIKKQIKENSKWNIEAISLNGSDAYETTYTYKNTKLYVMEPDGESVINAQEKIKSILN